MKYHYGLAMLRSRGIERVRLHADLTILGRLALELARARALPPAGWFTIPGVRFVRRYCASGVLGATVIAAVWLYTYRVATVVHYIDRTGREFRSSERISEQPWWSAPATVLVVLIGAGLGLWLLPERERLVTRFRARFANPS